MLLTLAKLADEAALPIDTVLHYQREGLIQPLAIAGTHQYGPDAQVKLKLISKAKRLGFSLAEIRELLRARRPCRITSL